MPKSLPFLLARSLAGSFVRSSPPMPFLSICTACFSYRFCPHQVQARCCSCMHGPVSLLPRSLSPLYGESPPPTFPSAGASPRRRHQLRASVPSLLRSCSGERAPTGRQAEPAVDRSLSMRRRTPACGPLPQAWLQSTACSSCTHHPPLTQPPPPAYLGHWPTTSSIRPPPCFRARHSLLPPPPPPKQPA